MTYFWGHYYWVRDFVLHKKWRHSCYLNRCEDTKVFYLRKSQNITIWNSLCVLILLLIQLIWKPFFDSSVWGGDCICVSNFPKKLLCDSPDQSFALTVGTGLHQSHPLYLKVLTYPASVTLQLSSDIRMGILRRWASDKPDKQPRYHTAAKLVLFWLF